LGSSHYTYLHITFLSSILPFSNICTYPFHFGPSHSTTTVPTFSTLDPPTLRHLCRWQHLGYRYSFCQIHNESYNG
jgi:hypothetical protein